MISISLSKNVNKILERMHAQQVPTEKGVYGEQAVFSICEDLYQRRGGILIHSYCYKVEEGLAGNIKRDGSSFYVENLGSSTEIDILLVTRYKIYLLEVKAYKSKKITLTNERIEGCAADSKSPVHQNEMHARHLYPKIFASLPDGQCYEYIVPIVVFTDETKIVDSRTPDQRNYMYVTILNQLRQLLEEHDKPHNGIVLDVPAIELKLRSAMRSYEKFLPYIQR